VLEERGAYSNESIMIRDRGGAIVEVKAGKERKEGGCDGDQEGVIYLTRLARRSGN